MKYILTLILTLFVLTSCTKNKQYTVPWEITGEFNQSESKSMSVIYLDSNGIVLEWNPAPVYEEISMILELSNTEWVGINYLGDTVLRVY